MVHRVQRYTYRQHSRLREPLENDSEIEDTARSIAGWVWQHHIQGGMVDDYTPAPTEYRLTQGERGRRSGAARRDQTWERDLEIENAVMGGQSMRSVARAWGLSDYAVRHIMARCKERMTNMSGAM